MSTRANKVKYHTLVVLHLGAEPATSLLQAHVLNHENIPPHASFEPSIETVQAPQSSQLEIQAFEVAVWHVKELKVCITVHLNYDTSY